MKVLVTGGTGFVGSHTVKALLDRGHQVKLLVRSPDRIAPALQPMGVDPASVEHVVGDITDPASMEAALEGTEGVMHGASVFTTDPRKARLMLSTNARSTEVVLGTARRLGLDPVVYISSFVALLPPSEATISGDSPVGSPSPAYSRSKAEAERVSRRMQDEGVPVTTVFPGFIMGPNDPHWGDPATFVENILKGRANPMTPGSAPLIDVREVAGALAAAMEPGKGPRRYVLGGTFIAMTALIDMVASLVGRKIRYITVPMWSVKGTVRLMDMFQGIIPGRLPINSEILFLIDKSVPTDDSRAEQELGTRKRPLEETLTDMIRWMHSTSRISDKQAGRLAG